MTPSTPTNGDDAAFRFLEHPQLDLAESQTNSTHRYALLIALVDLSAITVTRASSANFAAIWPPQTAASPDDTSGEV